MGTQVVARRKLIIKTVRKDFDRTGGLYITLYKGCT